jgi:hypothetical protein
MVEVIVGGENDEVEEKQNVAEVGVIFSEGHNLL